MESPFAPFSGGDLLPPATTSGGMANDSPPPCNRCGFGGCDIRVAGCGCLLHTVSTLCFPVLAYVGTGTNPTCFFSTGQKRYRKYCLVHFVPFLGCIASKPSQSYQLTRLRARGRYIICHRPEGSAHISCVKTVTLSGS